MSTTDGDDVPRDPWGNPLPPEDRAPVNPGPDDYLPPFPGDPPGGAAPAAPPAPPVPPANPAWPGDQPTQTTPPGPPPFAPPTGAPPQASPPAPPAAPGPPANPAWPGDQPTQAPPPPHQPSPGQPYPGQPGPGWGGPGVPPQQPAYPPGQYPGSDHWGGGSPWEPPRNDGLAIGALVCGILSGLCGLAGIAGLAIGPVAIGLGIAARNRISRSGGSLRGHGLATTGMILGIIGTIVSVFWLVLLIANPDLVQEMIDRFSSTTTTGG